MSNDSDDCNMSEYSNNWPEFLYPSVNPPISPQTDSIRERPDRNYTSGCSASTDPGRTHDTTSIVDPPQTVPFGFVLPDPVIAMQEVYSNADNWHLAELQDLSGPSGQSFNTAMPPNLWHDGHYLRDVQLHRFTSLDAC
jgi:hypothetical protein